MTDKKDIKQAEITEVAEDRAADTAAPVKADKKSDAKETASQLHARLKEDGERMVLPIDIRRKRIFWGLATFFVVLLCIALLLVVLLIDAVRPPGFGGHTSSAVPNFITSYYGSADALLDRPTSIAISPTGEIYVSDTNNARVVVFDDNGNVVRSITEIAPYDGGSYTTPGAAANPDAETPPAVSGDYVTPLEGTPEAFVAPTSLAFASDGRWYAVDQAMRMVMFFNADDQLLHAITLAEEAPISVKVNKTADSEQLFITTRSGILEADLDGNFRLTYLNWGLFSGELDSPGAVVISDPALKSDDASIAATDTAILTIVADTLNNRVQAFKNFEINPEVAWMYGIPILDHAAQVQMQYEFTNAIEGYMSAPVDMAVSPNGRLFVVDGLSSEIVVLNARTGEFLYNISTIGSRDGMLYYPSGIDYRDGNVYVADSFNNRVSLFEDAPPTPMQEEVTPVDAPNRWLWLLLPVALLLLALLRAFSIRMPRYIMDLSALESLSEDTDTIHFLIEHFDHVTIVAGTEPLAEKILPAHFWKSEVPKEAKRDHIIAAHPQVTDFSAEALALVARKRGRSYLITASNSAEKAGGELKLKVERYAQFRSLAHSVIEEEHHKHDYQKAADAKKAVDTTETDIKDEEKTKE
ncbi:MAG: NHL repeat-containing protein [Coriobacteriia bacterium]|nr:NHL repeat-containing protein [Coriobacteriia bacterium]MCL2536813.1 NHL repeat-containing protein [Coriobacteriia bacterium]